MKKNIDKNSNDYFPKEKKQSKLVTYIYSNQQHLEQSIDNRIFVMFSSPYIYWKYFNIMWFQFITYISLDELDLRNNNLKILRLKILLQQKLILLDIILVNPNLIMQTQKNITIHELNKLDVINDNLNSFCFSPDDITVATCYEILLIALIIHLSMGGQNRIIKSLIRWSQWNCLLSLFLS
ncbi:unnamed protein product [Paramecium pentaurelia]|uniref:Transmembrane protein n=1 Tax=Paramecium pentaurelia TaxID=43138 RepID=A0A8S1SN94_9CILI|nr:unnamed protein product [Paramecium pentaurelia]